MKLIDLTHTFTSDMPVFPGDPSVVLEQTVFIEKDGNNDHTLTTAMHVGTHIDAPFHMIESGKRIDEFSPDHFFGRGVLIDARGKKEIDLSVLEGVKIEKDTIVLIYTGFGEKFTSNDYFERSPAMTEDFAKKMIALNVKMVGMDTSTPDHDTNWPVHKLLLGKEIMILENLTNLNQLVNVEHFEVIALPLKLQTDASPVRVIAKV